MTEGWNVGVLQRGKRIGASEDGMTFSLPGLGTDCIQYCGRPDMRWQRQGLHDMNGDGLPDFAEIRVTYVPDARCIELKALKYYLISFRNRGIFYEQVTNQILDDLVAVCSPRRMVVVGDFSVRGGITTTVTASYQRPGYSKETGDRLEMPG